MIHFLWEACGRTFCIFRLMMKAASMKKVPGSMRSMERLWINMIKSNRVTKAKNNNSAPKSNNIKHVHLMSLDWEY